ncbi:hypothetical protein D3C85_1408920 [compost metagenome]
MKKKCASSALNSGVDCANTLAAPALTPRWPKFSAIWCRLTAKNPNNVSSGKSRSRSNAIPLHAAMIAMNTEATRKRSNAR